jgi:hypothetical protein
MIRFFHQFPSGNSDRFLKPSPVGGYGEKLLRNMPVVHKQHVRVPGEAPLDIQT